MADVQRRVNKSGEVRWDVRYRDDARQQRKRSFERKLDAQRFARSVETDMLRGDWIDPRRGQETFTVWAEAWMDTIGNRKPKTRESYESIVRRHLLPRFASTPIAAIDYPVVLAFVGDLQRAGMGAKTVRNIRDVLRLVLGLAVKSGALKANPVTGIEVARAARTEMVFLDPDQIMTLAAEITAPPQRYRRDERRRDGYPEYGLLVRFAAYTGLRAGEIVALRVKSLDLMRRIVDVNASGSEAYGQLQIVPTKTYERRSVPIPRSLIDELAEHVAGCAPDEFVWRSPHGGPFRHGNWFKRHFKHSLEHLTRSADVAVQLGMSERRPLPIRTLDEVGDQHMPMQQRITCTAGPMPKRRGHPPGCRLASWAVLGCFVRGQGGEPRLVVRAALHPDRVPFEPADRGAHRSLAGFDHCALHPRIVRHGVEHTRRLRGLERQIEPGHPARVRRQAVAVRGQTTVARSETCEHGAKIIGVDLTGEPEPSGRTADPLAVRLAGTRVVVVQRLRHPGELVGLLANTEFGDRQHRQSSGPPARRRHTQRVILCEENSPPVALGSLTATHVDGPPVDFLPDLRCTRGGERLTAPAVGNAILGGEAGRRWRARRWRARPALGPGQ
jgi:integrase